MKARQVLVLVAVVGALTACATSAPGTTPSVTTAGPIVVNSPLPGSFDLNALCYSLYGSAAPNAKGINDAWITGWECPGAKTPEITLQQMQSACQHEHPGFEVLNLTEPNRPKAANSQFQCLSPSGQYMVSNSSHEPGVWDVSTTISSAPFYAVPNFVKLRLSNGSGCGRPCWLPLYVHPVEVKGQAVTNGWPCEAYIPSAGSYCNRQPAGRAVTQMWVPGFPSSGDKVLVVCQTTGESISDLQGDSSTVWDGVAVPIDKLNALGRRSNLGKDPGLTGYRVALAPDIWLGNTGTHHLPLC